MAAPAPPTTVAPPAAVEALAAEAAPADAKPKARVVRLPRPDRSVTEAAVRRGGGREGGGEAASDPNCKQKIMEESRHPPSPCLHAFWSWAVWGRSG